MAGKNVTNLDDKNFNDSIKAGVALVDFWAPWCGPCRLQGPILDEVAESVAGKAVIGKVNVDENQNLAAAFGVQSIPTLLLFKNGKEIKRFVGLQQKESLVSVIEKNL